ncbi:MAG: response regulator transcription factor [Hymenobacter sp.]|nr:MAG: response regulator transcription factor [Hymenobacter sp.]
MIRVFLVDDHHLVRSGLHLLLATQPDLEIVGEAGNGLELLAQLPTTPTDVVVLDLNMPGMDGLETTRRLREQYPQVHILVLSMLNQESYVFQMLDAGAQGYVIKSMGIAEISSGIRTVAAGGQFLCTDAGRATLRRPSESPGEPVMVAAPAPGTLSRRELEILQLISDGSTTNEIADKLFISKRTVETHRQNMLEKMQASNTAALIRIAVRKGLVL